MNLDILFLTKLFPKENEQEILKKIKTNNQAAANTFQWNLINGLDANECGIIKIINYLPIDSYPNGYEERLIKRFVFHHTDMYNTEDINVGFNNTRFIKQIFNYRPIQKEVKEWVYSKEGKDKYLISYTANLNFLKVIKYVKKIDPNIKTCCIIADLPQYLTASDLKGVKKIHSDYVTKKSENLYKYVDKFVLLTKQMAEKVGDNPQYMVMEGIYSYNNIENFKEFDFLKNKKYVLYSGTLNYKFGIKKLIDAFSLINDDIYLVVCGAGPAATELKTSKNNRIIFLGELPREKVLYIQKNATVLVNPRENIEEFTKYSFPSKLMEYLASGVPVVLYKLDGIPDEYDEFFNYVNDDSVKSLASKIIEICNLTLEERIKIGEKGKDFVYNNKNYIIQTKKLLQFLINKKYQNK